MDGMALDKIAFINNTKDIYVADAVYNGIEGLNVTLYSYRDGREESVSVPATVRRNCSSMPSTRLATTFTIR